MIIFCRQKIKLAFSSASVCVCMCVCVCVCVCVCDFFFFKINDDGGRKLDKTHKIYKLI